MSGPINSSLFDPIKNWKVNGRIDACIGCDVGGSGFRIRIGNANNSSQFLDLPHVKAQTGADALLALNKIEKEVTLAIPDFASRAGTIAAAGPISGGSVVMTNWKGGIQERSLSLKDLPKKLFPSGKSTFLNDLEAGAYGIVAAHQASIIKPYFEPLWPGLAPEGPIVSSSRTAVLAMGSGLGIAVIIQTPLLKGPFVLATELGHLQIPQNGQKFSGYDAEAKLIQHLSDHYYNGTQAPEFEDAASGRGLDLLYQHYFLQDSGKKLPLDQIDAGDVASKAQKGDKVARQSLLAHYQIFLRSAKQVAISLSCDSVLLALDNQVKNDWFVRSVLPELKDEFYHFIRPDWLKNTRVYGQVKVLNFNLLGTVYMSQTLI